jgi:hypothetical protein
MFTQLWLRVPPYQPDVSEIPMRVHALVCKLFLSCSTASVVIGGSYDCFSSWVNM